MLAAITAALALVVPTPPAHVSAAAPAAADDDARRKEAARAFADGERAWARGDYAQAARKFGRAQELVPHPDTLYNLAVAQRRAGDPVAAWHTFTALIERATTKNQRREAEAARAQVRREVATIEVRAGPRRVCVDGVPLAAGEHRVVRPGDHVVSIDGTAVSVQVDGGETRTLQRVGEGAGEPRLRSSGKIVLGASIVAAAGAAGLGAGAGIVDDRATSRGLAFGAVALASAAAVGTIVVLATMHRPARAARPRPRRAAGTAAPSSTPSPCAG